MTKITLSSLSFILAGLLSLSSAHPIKHHEGSDRQGGSNIDCGDGSGRWSGSMTASSWRGRPSSVSGSKHGGTGTDAVMTESVIPTVTPSVSRGAINGTSWGHTKGPGGDTECDDSSPDAIPSASWGHTKDAGGDMECDDTSSGTIPTRTGSPSNGVPPKSSAVSRSTSGSVPTETGAPTRSRSMSSATPSATSEGRPGNGTTATTQGIETQREATVAAATSEGGASSSDGRSGKVSFGMSFYVEKHLLMVHVGYLVRSWTWKLR